MQSSQATSRCAHLQLQQSPGSDFESSPEIRSRSDQASCLSIRFLTLLSCFLQLLKCTSERRHKRAFSAHLDAELRDLIPHSHLCLNAQSFWRVPMHYCLFYCLVLGLLPVLVVSAVSPFGFFDSSPLNLASAIQSLNRGTALPFHFS
jgi:hypothetical protein